MSVRSPELGSGTGGFRSEPFDRNAEPLRSFFAFLEDADIDWRTLSQHGMQACIMNGGRIHSENG